jgi:hypothetical protein
MRFTFVLYHKFPLAAPLCRLLIQRGNFMLAAELQMYSSSSAIRVSGTEIFKYWQTNCFCQPAIVF